MTLLAFWTGIFVGVYIGVAVFMVLLLKPVDATRMQLIKMFFQPHKFVTMYDNTTYILGSKGEDRSTLKSEVRAAPISSPLEARSTDEIVVGDADDCDDLPHNTIYKCKENVSVTSHEVPPSRTEALESSCTDKVLVDAAVSHSATSLSILQQTLSPSLPFSVSDVPKSFLSPSKAMSMYQSDSLEAESAKDNGDASSKHDLSPYISPRSLTPIEGTRSKGVSVDNSFATSPLRSLTPPNRSPTLFNAPQDSSPAPATFMIELPPNDLERYNSELMQVGKRNISAMKATEAFFQLASSSRKNVSKEYGRIVTAVTEIQDDAVKDVWKSLGSVLDSYSCAHLDLDSMCSCVAQTCRDYEAVTSILELASNSINKDLTKLKLIVAKAVVAKEKSSHRVTRIFEELALQANDDSPDERLNDRVSCLEFLKSLLFQFHFLMFISLVTSSCCQITSITNRRRGC